MGTFVNPHGYVHELITVRHAEGLALVGPATAEHSWFPGYTWTICSCAACLAHVGWLFEAVSAASPPLFWGLRRAAIRE